MKTLARFLILASLLTGLHAREITWTMEHETAVQSSLVELSKQLPKQTAIVGRTSRTDTRVAVVMSKEGHLLCPLIPAADQGDAPYLLYRPDGSRLTLTTIQESKKRAVALLKIENPPADLVAARIASITEHTLVIPTTAPIASLGEPSSLFVDHLQFPPPEDANIFRLDSIFFQPGSPVLDLSGALVGTTLKARADNTPALMIASLVADLPKLDQILPDLSASQLPKLPRTPVLTREEIKELKESPLVAARERFIQTTHPEHKSCVLISNDNAQATHSAIGTIVRPDGLILTKASELGPSFKVRCNGKNYPGVLLSTDEETDLALVGIEATGLPAVTWHDRPPVPGVTVAAPVLLQESTEDMVSEPTSYLGTFSHLLKAGLPTVHATSQVTSLGLTTEQLDTGLTVAALIADTPAYESGLSPGDVITQIDNTPIASRADLTSFLDQSEVGQKVTIKATSAGTSKDFEVTLIRPVLIPPDTGIKLAENISMIPSVRRAPFPDVFVHTAPLNAWDCGSPLFDLRGRAIGLNIAAVSPARSIALPPKVVREALDRLLAQTRPF
ncbi:MAG: PDZ domain-containing protein [Akkermansiaceae bacterium]|jgi:S1-C subfamily serine protease